MRSGPWGGGNQFLKNLRKIWSEKELYAEKPEDADCILFNSHQNLQDVMKSRLKFPEKIYIHRIDGPISKYRGRNRFLDRLIFLFAEDLADGTVFQSRWSYEQSVLMGHKPNANVRIIHNASDPGIFKPAKMNSWSGTGKVKLVATSWSTNERKGFDVYEYLDSALNFEDYEFTFVGNSPVKFKNIKHITPVPPNEVAVYLSEADIFVSATGLESCSNSIIEAMSCGLPVVYREGSSNGEIVNDSGIPFLDKGDIISAIEQIKNNYQKYRSAVNPEKLEEAAGQYYKFMEHIHTEKKMSRHKSRKLSFLFLVKYIMFFSMVKIMDRIYFFKARSQQ